MKGLNSIDKLVVDANPILSALIGGRAKDAFLSPHIGELVTTRHTLGEVERYIPEFAKQRRIAAAGVAQADLWTAFAVMPLTVYRCEHYRKTLPEARRRIAARDPADADLLALALMLNAPIWTNDNDFEATGVECFTTAELLRALDA